MPTSCTSREPLIKLDEGGRASVLNYSLPQSTTYDAVSFLRLDIPPSSFKPSEQKAPKDDYWTRLERRGSEPLTPDSVMSILNGRTQSPVPELQNLAINLNATTPATKNGLVFRAGNIPVASSQVGFSKEHIANKVAQGYKPVLYKRLSGKQGLKFQAKPVEPDPAIYVVLHMKMASYLGDYGAGQTLNTFSLLPGEKTTITIRNYQRTEETRKAAESVLDSYSESCADDLQTTIEESTQQSESSSETDVDSMSAEMGVNGGVNLGIVKLGGDTKGSASSVNTTQDAVGSQVSTLNNAVSHHTQTADTQRQIEVNTETTSTSTTETEQTVTRSLENLNRSRVLNFVFRQLLQEYVTVTWLDSVSFVYSNGYVENRRTGTLASLGHFLRRVLVDEATSKSVKEQIHTLLCNIPDYTGASVGFIEKVTQELRNCIDPDTPVQKQSTVRKRAGLQQTVEGRTFNGIVLDVSRRILRTPSVIVDALLGQGDALDCYNQQLQEAAYVNAQLNNRKVAQALAIVDAISDPVEKAAQYQRLFGDCCCETAKTPETL